MSWGRFERWGKVRSEGEAKSGVKSRQNPELPLLKWLLLFW